MSMVSGTPLCPDFNALCHLLPGFHLNACLHGAAPIIDALATGLRECSSKPFVGQRLQLDAFLNSMLRSRISRRVLAEQHITLDKRR